MATNMIGHVRRVRKVDPNGNIYYDRGVSDVIFDPERGTSVKKDIDDLRAAYNSWQQIQKEWMESLHMS